MTSPGGSQTRDLLASAFGFDPDGSAAHFLVNIPAGSTVPVDISEHLTWDPERVADSVHLGLERQDGQVRCRLPRGKWNEIAEGLRAEFNARLKKQGRRPGKWRAGYNAICRPLGKELALLAWAIEDADPRSSPRRSPTGRDFSPRNGGGYTR